MHLELPAILKCLFCGRAGLELAPGSKRVVQGEHEKVREGTLVCPRCGGSYPIQDGIINFLPRRTPNIGPGQYSNLFRLTAWGYERFWRTRALTVLGRREWPPEEEFAVLLDYLNSDGLQRPGYEIAMHNEIAFYLDVGCSTCFYGRAIARNLKQALQDGKGFPFQVVGLDNSWAMLQEARKYIEGEGLENYISLVRADAENMPFIDGAFAGIANGAALNEFRHTATALRETSRTLDKNGNTVFMVQMAAVGKIGRAINKAITLPSGIKFFGQEQLNRLYREAGLKVQGQIVEGLITISHLRK
jgi:ubiquinone/menaquinone biosynthesis C-methylase UbiE